MALPPGFYRFRAYASLVMTALVAVVALVSALSRGEAAAASAGVLAAGAVVGVLASILAATLAVWAYLRLGLSARLPYVLCGAAVLVGSLAALRLPAVSGLVGAPPRPGVEVFLAVGFGVGWLAVEVRRAFLKAASVGGGPS